VTAQILIHKEDVDVSNLIINKHEHDMLEALMGSSYKNGTPLTDSDIAHMMIALLMAGQHTSSATSSWTLLHLAQRHDI
jgi:sterol 14alpha-demethylase